MVNTTSNQIFYLNSTINYVENGIRISTISIYTFYFIFLIIVKKFQERQLIYLHHVNLIGFIVSIHYVCYIASPKPNFEDEMTNSVLCTISSFVWTITNFLRIYSLVLLALYRYFAVYKINFYRKWTRSLWKIWLGIFVAWISCLIITFVLKYSFNTTYSVFYCFEGNN